MSGGKMSSTATVLFFCISLALWSQSCCMSPWTYSSMMSPASGLRIHTVPELKLDQYYGRWYEMYSNLIVKLTFERNSFCTTATYGENPNGTVSVFNSGRNGSPTGPPKEISGYAYVPDPAQPGQLKLKFPDIPLGDYWVIALGPVIGGEYQYSVVTVPSMLQLFILARDPDKFRADYDDEVLAFTRDAGFSYFWNRPRPTVQEPGCIYPPDAHRIPKNPLLYVGQ